MITEAAVTDSGLFHVHRVDEKLYYEVPDSLLERDMLLVSRIARVPADLGSFAHPGYKAAEQTFIRCLRDIQELRHPVRADPQGHVDVLGETRFAVEKDGLTADQQEGDPVSLEGARPGANTVQLNRRPESPDGGRFS